MLKIFKNLKWLSDNKENLEDLLKLKKEENLKLLKKPKDKNYDLSGVPDYQLQYVNDILNADK